MNFKFFPYQHSLRDGEDLGGGGDRGDVIEETKDAPLTDEEKKLATELKAKEEADAKAAKEKDDAAKKLKEAKVEDEEDEEKKRKDTRIPLARHKELLEAERLERAKAEAKLAQYQGVEDIEKTNAELVKAEDRLIGLEAEYAKLVVDGKDKEAGLKMGEIRKLERGISDIRMDLKTAAAESRAYERARYDTTVERIQAAYPILNDDNKDHEDPEMRFNPAKVTKVLSIARAYQQDGMTPSAAIQEAVKDLLGDPKTAKQKQAVDVTPQVDDAAVKKAAREEAARVKAAEAAGKTPPSASGVGKDGEKLGGKGGDSLSGADVMKMSYESFAKLDENTLARLRGDLPE